MGNAMFFKRIAAPRLGSDISSIQFGLDRYHNEAVRLLGIIEERVKDREWLCGPGKGKFTVADISCHGYAKTAGWWTGIDLSEYTAFNAWFARVEAQPRVIDGCKVPNGKLSVMIDDSEAGIMMRRKLEANSKSGGRPHFGWKDIHEVGLDSYAKNL